GGQIFNQASPFEISGPDGPGGLLPINNWSANGSSDIGLYDIQLECVGAVPEPATCSIVLVGLGFALARGRRLA
ncbi:MAG: PEP-CTERM sorting domain-containing protein, partial [Planctomycetes bacterium]|nr:PEP-CTERM sorting domain-containing protein [Planctomycetota bacterium]